MLLGFSQSHPVCERGAKVKGKSRGASLRLKTGAERPACITQSKPDSLLVSEDRRQFLQELADPLEVRMEERSSRSLVEDCWEVRMHASSYGPPGLTGANREKSHEQKERGGG